MQIKDKYYYEACEDAKETSIKMGYTATDQEVEAHAAKLREQAEGQSTKAV